MMISTHAYALVSPLWRRLPRGAWLCLSVALLCCVAAVAAAPDTTAEAEVVATDTPATALPGEPRIEVEAAGLKGIEPQSSTVEDLKKVWGEPGQESDTQGVARLTYQMAGFKLVEAYAKDGKVLYIVVHFVKPIPPEVVAKQLKFDGVEPVTITDDADRSLGQAYPERGVVFSFDPASKAPAVLQILLEGVTAEPFVTRAEKRLAARPLAGLADVNYAIERDPKLAKAHALRAEILLLAGRPEESLKSAAQATTLAPATHAYRLTKAKALVQLGRFDAAAQEASTVLAAKDLAAHDKARALVVLGDLVADSPERNFKQALKLHMEAIELADSLSGDAKPSVRRAAKHVLVDAHLGAAQDIVSGPWNKKEQVVPKWVGRAAEAADDLVKNEGADPRTRLAFFHRALSIHARLKGQPDAARLAQDMLAIGERLMSSSTDGLAQSQIRWQLASGLYSAMQISHAAAKAQVALQHGQAALAQLEAVRTGGYTSPEADYLQGQIFFRMGAVYAVLKEDHNQATAWYSRALPHLEKPAPPSALHDASEQAEALTSMGVSFWQVGQRDKAVQLTAEGVHLIERAVEERSVEPSTLEVPYTNLASMHGELGDEEKSKQFAELAAKAKQGSLRK